MKILKEQEKTELLGGHGKFVLRWILCVIGKAPTNVGLLLASSSRTSSSYRNKIRATVAKNVGINA